MLTFTIVISTNRALGEEAHLNTSFKHFMLFVIEFGLIERKELIPMEELIVTLTSDSN